MGGATSSTATSPIATENGVISRFSDFIQYPFPYLDALREDPEKMGESLASYTLRNPIAPVEVLNWMCQPSEQYPLGRIELIARGILRIQMNLTSEEWSDLASHVGQDTKNNAQIVGLFKQLPLLRERVAKVGQELFGKLQNLEASETRDRLLQHLSQWQQFVSSAGEAVFHLFFAPVYMEQHYKLMGKSPDSDPESFQRDLSQFASTQNMEVYSRFCEIFGPEKPPSAHGYEFVREILEVSNKGKSDPIGRIFIEGFSDLVCELYEHLPALSPKPDKALGVITRAHQAFVKKMDPFFKDRSLVRERLREVLEDPILMPTVEMYVAKMDVIFSILRAIESMQSVATTFQRLIAEANVRNKAATAPAPYATSAVYPAPTAAAAAANPAAYAAAPTPYPAATAATTAYSDYPLTTVAVVPPPHLVSP